MLNGVDGLVFTAGIGENPSVREKICENLSSLGIELDLNKNRTWKTMKGLSLLQIQKLRL